MNAMLEFSCSYNVKYEQLKELRSPTSDCSVRPSEFKSIANQRTQYKPFMISNTDVEHNPPYTSQVVDTKTEPL